MALKHKFGGFTLLELVLAMAILAILVALIGNLANNTATATGIARLQLETDAEARMIFDRMALDFASILKRKDIDSLFLKQRGNDKLFFYSETPAYFLYDPAASKRSPLALVGYRINAKFELERLGKGMAWDDEAAAASLNFLVYSNPRSRPIVESTIAGRWKDAVGEAPEFNGTDRDYHVLGKNVCRLELCFRLKQTESTVKIYSATPYYPAHSEIAGIEDVAAVIVTIGLLDSSKQTIEADKRQLAGALLDAKDSDLQADPPLMAAALWQEQISSPGFANSAGVTQAAVSRLRIYSRCFNLNH